MDDKLFYFMRKIPVNLLRYLPKFLSKDKTFKNVEDTLSWEHENYRLKLVDIAKQFFLETSTWGLSDWERFLAITPSENDSFEHRKAVCRVKLRGAGTMTVENTKRLMREFMTAGEPDIVELGDNEIELILDNGVYDWQGLFQALFEYLPAHLAFSINFKIHNEDELFIGIPTADIDEQFIEGAAVPNLSDEITIGIVIQDCGVDTIDYDAGIFELENNLVSGIIFQDLEEIKIAADTTGFDYDSEFAKLLWEKWLKWKHNPLVKIYSHNFDDDDEEIDPDEPETFPLGDFLRLYWQFPYTNRLRTMTFLNPRENIRGNQINAISLYSRANEIVMNSRGKISTGIIRALYITKTEEKIL